MPFVGSATVARLLEAAADSIDGAMLVDEAGRRQYLAAAYRCNAAARAPCDTRPDHQRAGASRRLGLDRHGEVAADPDEAFDVDTWADVERSRRLLEES